MNIIFKSVLIIIVLTSCRSAEFIMNVDSSLEANAQIYKMKSPSSWFDEKLNVTFGDYRVSKTDITHTTKSLFGLEITWVSTLFGKDIGFTKNTIMTSISYKFEIANGNTWDSKCVFVAEKKEIDYKKVTLTDISSPKYACLYTLGDDQSWTLTFTYDDTLKIDVEMVSKENFFKARTIGGRFVASDGRTSEFITPHDTGYTWTSDGKSIAAIFFREIPPKVWLDKRNTRNINDVISMANTGLLVYYWEISPLINPHGL